MKFACFYLFFPVLYFLLPPPVHANDSTAMIAAGGITLQSTNDIAMLSEDLVISAREIRVSYVFKNLTNQDIKTIVAFPFPDLVMADHMESDISGMDETPADNFLEFSVKSDGHDIPFKKEFRALVGETDVASTLTALKLPWQSMSRRLQKALQTLSTVDLEALKKLDAVAVHGDFISPLWTVKTTFYWDQVFPAGKNISIAHRYTPIVGKSFFYESALTDDYMKKPFCIDAPTAAALKKRLRERENHDLYTSYVGYILKTGANWSGPIGSFTLTLDKGAPENIISTCLSGLVKTTPTTFFLKKENFVPKEDLHILIVSPNL